MEFRLLGPLEVVSEGQSVPLPGGKPRALLALLLLDAGRVVSAEALVDRLWGERPPVTAAKIVQGYVSRLRRLLREGVLETRPPGYVLRVREEELDVLRFGSLVAAADGAEPARAAALLREALALWRGPALADVVPEIECAAEAGRLEELRLAALERRIEAELALGGHVALVPELEALVAAHPFRERLRTQLLLALYRSGRQADALAAYRQARELFVDELGIEPGAELQELERRILVQDAALAPPASAAPLPPLPLPPTPLVGRRRERRELDELLRRPEVRLLTLVGAGGVGKTRLALAVVAGRTAACFVSLAPVTEPRLVRRVVADALGLHSPDELVEALRARELLLVLDNFEHLLDAAPLVAELLAAAPALTVVATSRAPLAIAGERQYAVAPLPESDAVALFVARAAATGAAASPSETTVELCRRVDCLPLAIELAAARTKTLSEEALLARLERRLPLLVRGARDAPERQRTLRATIEWSHALLDPDEQRLLARLSVFAGDWTLEAAEDVCGATLDTLESLVDESLVQQLGDRFRLLETIKEYARERLDEGGEAVEVERRHAERIHVLARALLEAELEGQPHADLAADLTASLDDVRVALRSSLDRGDHELTVRLASALRGFWAYGRQKEGAGWLAEARAHLDSVPLALRAEALLAAAMLEAITAEGAQATLLAEEALAIYRELGDAAGAAEALRWLGNAHGLMGEYARARPAMEASIELHERLGQPVHLARALLALAGVEQEQGNLERSEELLRRALALTRASGPANSPAIEHSLADVALDRGAYADARGWYRSLLQDAAATNPRFAVWCIAGLAAAAALEDDHVGAGHLWGAVESFEREHGPQVIGPERERYERALASAAGPELDAALAHGRTLTLEQAIAEALAVPA